MVTGRSNPPPTKKKQNKKKRVVFLIGIHKAGKQSFIIWLGPRRSEMVYTKEYRKTYCAHHCFIT